MEDKLALGFAGGGPWGSLLTSFLLTILQILSWAVYANMVFYEAMPYTAGMSCRHDGRLLVTPRPRASLTSPDRITFPGCEHASIALCVDLLRQTRRVGMAFE